MKVILLTDVHGTGKKYDVKTIPDGYAMNFLLPNKLAERATPEKIKNIENLKEEEKEEIKIQEELLDKNIAELKKITVEIQEKANEKGHLFKGVTKEAIAKALKKQTNMELPVEMLELERPIKEVGKHVIEVSAGDKKASLTLFISS